MCSGLQEATHSPETEIVPQHLKNNGIQANAPPRRINT
jgi:hypothetical protein